MSNYLANQASLYLRQHANNPVDWWPWCDPALTAARAEGKPILLSIGYSACHWCHVMAHESFEDDATAALMNELFVNIKVDREERPDLDRVYQSAHQALTGRGGGWPLTVFLDAETLLPFFAGTYYPASPRHGLPGFCDLLRGVRRWHDQQPQARQQQDTKLAAWLQRQSSTRIGELADATPLHAALTSWQAQFDPDWGGHRGAPKFPHATELELLLDLAGDDLPSPSPPTAATILRRSLHGMADGGLQDHLGGGFFRYSVDARWEIPHFEKMLYDNAQLLGLYARASVQLGESTFSDAAHATARWLQHDMALPTGGYAAALDADSEGAEGSYYLWQRAQVENLLEPPQFAVAARRYGVDQPPNFERQSWHLTARTDTQSIGEALDLAPRDVNVIESEARVILLHTRAQRPPPALDDKLLCAWNALAITALARSARLLHAPELLQQAETALDAVRAALWRDGRLHGASTSSTPGFLDDHALLLDALLEMLASQWQRRHLDWAIQLAEHLLRDFADHDGGGFYFTAHDHQALPQRPKPFTDESLPSGNGVAARGLLRLGHLLGEMRYVDAAEASLRAARFALDHYPQACASVLRALRLWLKPTPQVIIYCRAAQSDLWRDAASIAGDRVDVWLIPAAADDDSLPGVLGQRRMRGDGTAWLCEGMQCRAPLQSPAALHGALVSLH